MEVPDDGAIDSRSFNFVTIKDIQLFQEQELRCKVIDIIGVVHYIGMEQDIQTKTGIYKKKRMISIADDSGLWI